jgi:hypothetical protein
MYSTEYVPLACFREDTGNDISLHLEMRVQSRRSTVSE